MVKKVYIKIILSLVVAFTCILCMPFHIYAAGGSVDYDDVIEGVYYSGGVQSPKEFTWVFNQPVVGYFQPAIKYKPTNNGTTSTHTPTVYVNGTEASYLMSVGTDIIVQSVTNSFDMLYDNSGNQLGQFTYPIESFPMVYYCLNQGFTSSDLFGYGYYQYPLLETNTTGYISAFQANANSDMFVILWSDRAINTSNATSYLTWSSDYSLVSAEMLAYAPGNRTVKLTFHNNSNSAVRLDLKWTITGRQWFPIYQWYVQDKYDVSTDFGLLYGLDNDFIITLKSLAPTNTSEESISDLDDSQAQLDSVVDNVDSYEQQFTSDFNDSLDEIDTQFQWGSNFLTSANWVKTQFDTLTNNNVFGSLLTFSLILGLSLLIIGKVFK